jgi:hypothetical protein
VIRTCFLHGERERDTRAQWLHIHKQTFTSMTPTVLQANGCRAQIKDVIDWTYAPDAVQPCLVRDLLSMGSAQGTFIYPQTFAETKCHWRCMVAWADSVQAVFDCWGGDIFQGISGKGPLLGCV